MPAQVSLVMRMVREVRGTKMRDALVVARRQRDRQVNALIATATWRALRLRDLIDGTGRITELGEAVAETLDSH